MAYKFYTIIDLLQNQIQNVTLHKASTPPSSPVEAQLYYDTDDKSIYYYDGSSWIKLTTSSTVFSGKESVKVATTANITLSGAQTIDGVSVTTSDRVLVKNQTNAAENGIYVVSTGAWSRATDADAWDELVSAYVFVRQGSTQADTGWLCTVDPGGTLGTSSVTWTQFSDTGNILAGTGLTKTGNTIDVNVDNSTIKVDGSDNLYVQGYTFVSGATVGRKYQSNSVALSSTATTVTHNLGTSNVIISVVESTSKQPIIVDYDVVSTSAVEFTASTSVTADITIIG